MNPQLVLEYVYILIHQRDSGCEHEDRKNAGRRYDLMPPNHGKELALPVAAGAGRRDRKTESERQRQEGSDNGKYSPWT